MNEPLDEITAYRKLELVTTKQLAILLHVSVPTIKRWSRDGIIIPIKINGVVLWSYEDVCKQIKKHAQ